MLNHNLIQLLLIAALIERFVDLYKVVMTPFFLKMARNFYQKRIFTAIIIAVVGIILKYNIYEIGFLLIATEIIHDLITILNYFKEITISLMFIKQIEAEIFNIQRIYELQKLNYLVNEGNITLDEEQEEFVEDMAENIENLEKLKKIAKTDEFFANLHLIDDDTKE